MNPQQERDEAMRWKQHPFGERMHESPTSPYYGDVAELLDKLAADERRGGRRLYGFVDRILMAISDVPIWFQAPLLGLPDKAIYVLWWTVTFGVGLVGFALAQVYLAVTWQGR